MHYKDTHSEQFSYYRDLYEKTQWRIDYESPINRKRLADFILSNRDIVSNFLKSDRGSQFKIEDEEWRKKTLWFDFIAEQRELSWIPKEIPYDLFNIYIQIIETHNENLDFDEFLKMFHNKKLKHVTWEVSDNMENLMYNGWGWEFHAVSEIISNAIDATHPQHVVGRFWKWFFQSGRFLRDENTKILVQSKKQNHKGYQISLQNKYWIQNQEQQKELYVWSQFSDKQDIGTTVEIQRKFSKQQQEKLLSYIHAKFRTNKSVNIIVNGSKVNHLNNYVYVNGETLREPTKDVKIVINNDGIQVIDKGVWMNSKELSTKLLFPNDTSKARKQPDENDLHQVVEKEVSFFYEKWQLTQQKQNGELKKQKTNISLMIWGVIIEDFHVETSHDIKDFVLEFPSFTYLMENKNEISLTKEVIISLQIMLEKIHSKIQEKQQKIAALEVLWSIVSHLKNRPTQDSTSGKYNIDTILKRNFKQVKQDLEQWGTTVIAWDKKLMEALWSRKDIMYISPDFEVLELKNIPWVEKITDIENATLPFYTIDFDSESSISYIITKKWILVDKKYLREPETRSILNVLVNLNVDYEIDSERVYYGRIAHWKVVHTDIGENSMININPVRKWDFKPIESNWNTWSLQKEAFIEIHSNLVLDLKERYSFPPGHFNQKEYSIHKEYCIHNLDELDDLLNSIHDIWKINSKITFYYLVFFEPEDAFKYKNTDRYIRIFESLSDTEQKSLMMFTLSLYSVSAPEKYEYLDTVLNLFENENIKKNVQELIDNLWGNREIIPNIFTLHQINKLKNKLNQIETISNQELYTIYEYDNITFNEIFKELIHRDCSDVVLYNENDVLYWRIKVWALWYAFYWSIWNFHCSEQGVPVVEDMYKIKWGIAFETRENESSVGKWCGDLYRWIEGNEVEKLSYQEGNQVWKLTQYQVTDGIICGYLLIWEERKYFEWENQWIMFNLKKRPTSTKIVSSWEQINERTRQQTSLEESIHASIWIAWFNFVNFLIKWWEFLGNKNQNLWFEDLKWNFALSELMYLNNLQNETLDAVFDDRDIGEIDTTISQTAFRNQFNTLRWRFSERIKGIFRSIHSNNITPVNTSAIGWEAIIGEENIDDYFTEIDALFYNIQEKNLNFSIYKRKILSQIDGQDKSSQIWIREGIQNAIDALKNAWLWESWCDIDFFENNWNFISSISDSVWMTLEEVFRYLLPIWKSGKQDTQWLTGKFGQWFFSLFIGAKEVNVKTSSWSGKTNYLRIKPLYNRDNLIEDFDISFDVKDENFKWTTIERVDEAEWIEANLSAMFWIHNIVKYVWVVDGIDVRYNWEVINNKNKILQTENIPKLWVLTLLENSGIERVSKDGLYMSELKEIYVDMFPEWVVEIIKEQKLTLDIPSWIDLVSSRNEISDIKNLHALQPYIFNIIAKHIVTSALDGKIKIPMLPEDYFWLDYYEQRIEKFREINSYATQVNKGWNLDIWQTELLKNKSNMALFLLMLEVNKAGEKVSLQILKKKRNDAQFVHRVSQGRMAEAVGLWSSSAESLNKSMEHAERKVLSIKKISEILNIDEGKIKNFIQFMDTEFSLLTQKVFWKNIKHNIYQRENWESRAASYGFDTNGIYMNWNIQFIKKWIVWYKSDSGVNEGLIETVTHELTHLKEGSHKWWSHEKDLEHEDSFEKLQREILETYLRLKKDS